MVGKNGRNTLGNKGGLRTSPVNRAWPGQGARHQHHIHDIMAIKAYDKVATVTES